jgi:hypothetical protein
MKRYLLLACLLPVALVAPANSVPEESLNLSASGNDFLRVCEPRREHGTFIDGACTGYTNGVIDGYDYAFALIQAQHHEPVKGAFCPPDEVTRGQQYRAAVKFMQDHPEKSHRIASALIADSMVEAFPCAQAKAPETAPNK